MNNAVGPALPLILDKKNGFLMHDNYIDEIKQNVRILFLTNPGERVRDPLFGVGLKRYLFENVRAGSLKKEIQLEGIKQAKKYLPFIVINSIDVFESDEQENTIQIHIDYFIQPFKIGDQMTISFKQ